MELLVGVKHTFALPLVILGWRSSSPLTFYASAPPSFTVLEEVMDAKYLGLILSNERLKKTTYFSFIRSFMEYGVTVWDPYQKYNSDKIKRVHHRAARLVKSSYTRYYSVSDMLDDVWLPPASQRRQEARLILFSKIINGLAHVLVGTGLLSLEPRHWLY